MTGEDAHPAPKNGHVRYGNSVDDNPVRSLIMRLLDEQPGLSIREISETINLSRGAVRHHLHILIKKDHAVAYRQGNQRLHFTVATPPMRRKAVYLLRIGSLRSFVEATIEETRFRPAELAKELGLSARSVRRAMQMLEKADLVRRWNPPAHRGLCEISYHPELLVAWTLYIKDAGRNEVRPLHKHPGVFMGISAMLGKVAAIDAGS